MTRHVRAAADRGGGERGAGPRVLRKHRQNHGRRRHVRSPLSSPATTQRMPLLLLLLKRPPPSLPPPLHQLGDGVRAPRRLLLQRDLVLRRAALRRRRRGACASHAQRPAARSTRQMQAGKAGGQAGAQTRAFARTPPAPCVPQRTPHPCTPRRPSRVARRGSEWTRSSLAQTQRARPLYSYFLPIHRPAPGRTRARACS